MAARTLGLKVAAVNVIHSNSGPLLLVINAAPELRFIEPISGRDIAVAIGTTLEKSSCGQKTRLSYKPFLINTFSLTPSDDDRPHREHGRGLSRQQCHRVPRLYQS